MTRQCSICMLSVTLDATRSRLSIEISTIWRRMMCSDSLDKRFSCLLQSMVNEATLCLSKDFNQLNGAIKMRMLIMIQLISSNNLQ